MYIYVLYYNTYIYKKKRYFMYVLLTVTFLIFRKNVRGCLIKYIAFCVGFKIDCLNSKTTFKLTFHIL